MSGKINHKTFVQFAALKLKEIDIDAYNECEKLCTPKVDLKYIHQIMARTIEIYPPTPENSPFILGIVLYLLSPYRLYENELRLQNGLRMIICEYMNWADGPVFNYYRNMLIAYYKGPRYAAKVEEAAEYIKTLIVEHLND